MNKLFCKFKKLIAVSLLIGCTFISTNTAFGADFIYGDVNEDSIVNTADYSLLRRHVDREIIVVSITRKVMGFRFVSKSYKVFQLTSEYSLKAADVNADGIIDSTDCAVFRAYILGMSKSLPSNIVAPN